MPPIARLGRRVRTVAIPTDSSSAAGESGESPSVQDQEDASTRFWMPSACRKGAKAASAQLAATQQDAVTDPASFAVFALVAPHPFSSELVGARCTVYHRVREPSAKYPGGAWS